MGLFDFVASAGRKLGIDYFEQEEQLKKLDDAAARVQKETALREQMSTALTTSVLDLHLDIEGFTVRVLARGKAKLSGVAPSQQAKEVAVLVVGNVEGIVEVDDSGLSVKPSAEKPVAPAVMHTVVKGDTLSLIAKRYYGIIMAFDTIADANVKVVADVNKIEPGWVLRVPPIAGIFYTSKQGDTLSGIAKTMYGDLKLYPLIFDANVDVLTSPDVLKPGTELLIPVRHELSAANS